MSRLVRQAVRFGAVGLINTAVGLVLIYSAMYFFGLGPGVANAIGYGFGLIISFGLNRIWTFEEKRPARIFLGRYILVAGVAYLCNMCAVLAGVSVFHINPYLIQLLGISLYTVLMFFGCKWLVFRPQVIQAVDGIQGRP
jgi:putative flippase GtrA